MIKAVIFDCYGVIIGQGFEHTYRIAGGDPRSDKAFINEVLYSTNNGQISRGEFNSAVAKKLNLSVPQWLSAAAKAEQPDEQLLDYIKSLRKKYKTAILSNASRGALDSNFGGHNLEDYFDEIVVSAEVGLIKPDDKIFRLTAEKLGVASNECIFIDDHQSNIEAAAALGMKTIFYQGFEDFKDKIEESL